MTEPALYTATVVLSKVDVTGSVETMRVTRIVDPEAMPQELYVLCKETLDTIGA